MAAVAVSVEEERLAALCNTQRRHIEELNTQLAQCEERCHKQQLQLAEQSPARGNARRLLAAAAEEQRAAARQVRELRAQRNALLVTKAALTAQVSEMIRLQAERAEREEALIAQLAQLSRAVGAPPLAPPEQQLAAAIAFVQQARQERGLTPKEQLPATSELIWESSCTGELFAAQRGGGSCQSTSTSYATAWSRLSSISPLRGSSARGSSSSRPPPAGDEQPPAAEEDSGSPLSEQSLSAFSGGKPSPKVGRRSLLSSPIRRCALQPARGRSPLRAQPAAPMADDGSGSGSDSSSSVRPAARADGCGQRDQQQQGGGGSTPGASAEAQGSAGFGSNISLGTRSTRTGTPSTVGRAGALRLEPEFRLAVCEGGLWPSPGAAAALAAAAGAPPPTELSGCSVCSHRLWLPVGDAGECEVSPSEAPALVLDRLLEAAAGSSTSSSNGGQGSLRPRRGRPSSVVVASLLLGVPLAVAASGAARLRHEELAQLLVGLGAAAQHVREGWQGAWQRLARARPPPAGQ